MQVRLEVIRRKSTETVGTAGKGLEIREQLIITGRVLLVARERVAGISSDGHSNRIRRLATANRRILIGPIPEIAEAMDAHLTAVPPRHGMQRLHSRIIMRRRNHTTAHRPNLITTAAAHSGEGLPRQHIVEADTLRRAAVGMDVR